MLRKKSRTEWVLSFAAMVLAAAVGFYLDGGTPTVAQADAPAVRIGIEAPVEAASAPAVEVQSRVEWKVKRPAAEVECAAAERRATETSPPAPSRNAAL